MGDMKTKLLTVAEFADVYSGGTPSTKNSNYWDGGIPWITPKDMSAHSGVYIDQGARSITEQGLHESAASLLPVNTIILSSRAPVGYVAIAKKPLSTNQGCKNLQCKEEVAFPKFIYYLLRNSTKKLRAHATGSTYTELSTHRLKNISFCLPENVKIQEKISSVLSGYDDLIENNRRRIQLLEQAARLLYKEWFIHLRFPGYEHTTITDSIPKGWERRHLSQLLSTQYGFTEIATNKPVGPRFLRGTDINKTSYIDWNIVPYCSDEKLDFEKFALQVDDIVVIRMADPGKVAIVETEQKAVFASYLVRLTRKRGVTIPALYLFYVLSYDTYQGFIAKASGGSTRKSASAKLLIDFNILIPPPTLIAIFIKQIQPLRNQIQMLLQQNASMKQARDLLLPRLMNGKIALSTF